MAKVRKKIHCRRKYPTPGHQPIPKSLRKEQPVPESLIKETVSMDMANAICNHKIKDRIPKRERAKLKVE